MQETLLGPTGWLGLGLAFALFELSGAAPFVTIFFAAGAFVAAAGQALHLLDAPWSTGATFLVASVGPLLVLRTKLVAWAERRAHDHPIDALVGQPVSLLQALEPQGAGLGSLRGTRWQVRNVGHAPLASSARPKVVALEGLTLLVAKDGQELN